MNKKKTRSEILTELLLEKEFPKLAVKKNIFHTYQEASKFLREQGLPIKEAFEKFQIPIPAVDKNDLVFLLRIIDGYNQKVEIENAKEILQDYPHLMANLQPLNNCQHQWLTYQGLSEKYEYCSICDEKK